MRKVRPKVAQLISAKYTPTSASLCALEQIDLNNFLKQLGAIQDLRLDTTTWQLVIQGEMNMLRIWALSRLLAANRSQRQGIPSVDWVLSLLPSHSLFIHIFRRAVPFAALGIPTYCSIADPSLEYLVNAIEILNRFLGLEGNLRVLTIEERERKLMSGSPKSLLVATGKRGTMEMLKTTWGGLFAGASGRCAVGIFHRKATTIYAALRSRRIPHSCTNARAGFRYSGSINNNSSVLSLESSLKRPLRYVLGRLHPSVVLLQTLGEKQAQPDFLCGYRVVLVRQDGTAVASAGFGSDPYYGWPGDYLI